MVIHLLYRYIRRENLEMKPHIRLLIFNIIVLLFVFLIGYLKFSCETKSKKVVPETLKQKKRFRKILKLKTGSLELEILPVAIIIFLIALSSLLLIGFAKE